MADDVKDTRIVEMQFDSKDFDGRIRKSQKTLEDFKKSLNFDDAVTQMQDLNESSSILEGMAKNLSRLTKEFTGIGSLSTYIQQKIKNGWQQATNSAESFIKSMTVMQKQAGAEKYDGLLKAVQTIKNATGDAESYVYSVLDKLNKYTDETSYDFADMAKNIGKFTTAGIGLEDAEIEMEGIANWAALAGQGVNEAQRAMYNLSQAMSAGYLLKIDYKSIQNANMDIRKFREEAIKAAVEVGTLVEKNGKYKTKKGNKEVNLDNFAETLSYKWFDKATMEKVFKTFADNTQGIGEEAYKAAQRCVTFKDALNAIKDMLSTGWMKSYELVFGKLSDAMDLFSGLCNKASEALSSFVETRNKILEHWNAGGGRNSLWGMLVGEIETPDGKTLFKGAYGILDAFVTVSDLVQDAFRSFVRMFVREENLALYDSDPNYMYTYLGSGLAVLTKNVQQFINQINTFLNEIPEGASESRFDQIRHVVEAIYATIVLITQVAGGVARFVGEILGQLTPAFDAVGQLISYISQLFTGKVVQGAKKNVIGDFFHNLAEMLRPVTTIINVVVTVLSRLIAIVNSFLNQTGIMPALLQALQRIVGLVGQAFNKILTSDMFKDFIAWIQNLVTNIPGAIQKLKAFGASILESIKNTRTFGTFWNWAKTTFSGKSLNDVWAMIKGRFKSLTDRLPTLLPDLKSRLGVIWGKIVGVLDGFFGKILGFFTGSAKAEEASDTVNKFFLAAITPGGAGDTLSLDGEGKTSSALIAQLRESFNRIWNPVKDFVSNFFSVTIPNFFKSDAVKALGQFFQGTTFMGLLGGVTNLVKWLAIFRTGSGLVAAGRGVRKLGVGLKTFGKNLKNLNLTSVFKGMFNFTNTINSNNVDNSRVSNWENFGNSLLKIAGAIALVAGSAYLIGQLKPEQLQQAGIALGAMILGLVAADFAAKRLGGGGKGIMQLAIGVTLLIIPLKALMSIPFFSGNGRSGLLAGIVKLGGVIAALALGSRWAGGIQNKGFVSFAVAVNLLLHPLRELIKMPFITNKGIQWATIQAFVNLGLLITAMAAAARLAGGNKLKGFVGLAVALNLLLIPIKVLSGMDFGAVMTGVGPLIGIILALTLLASVAKGEKLASLAGVVTAITALAFVGSLIAKMDWRQAVVGFAPIILMLGFIALLVRSAKNVDANKITALKNVFITFSIAIAAIAGSLAVITLLGVEEKTILEFFGGLVLTLLTMALVVRAAAGIDKKGIIAVGIAFLGVFAIIAAITGSLALIKHLNIDWQTLLVMMAGIATIVAVVGIFLPILSKMNPGGALVAVIAIAAVVAAIMGVIGLMADYLLGQVGNALGRISARLKTASGLLQDFFDRMNLISEDSVNHAQAIIDKTRDLVTSLSGLTAYEADISSFLSQMNRLGTGFDLLFLNESKYPDPEASLTFKNVNKLVEIGPSLASFNVGNFPEQVFSLGVALGLFNTATAGITEDKPKALSLMEGLFGQADNIAAFVNLPLADLTTKMSDLGGAMSLYAKGAGEVTGVNQEGVISLSDAVNILNEIVGAMNAEGGLADFTIPENMPDEASIGVFGVRLSALAIALGSFIDTANRYSTSTENALTMLKSLAEINTNLTKDNLAFVTAFPDAGVNFSALSVFALDIGKLGTALADFVDKTNGKDFSSGLDALGKLQEINGKLTADNLAFVKAFTDAGISGTGASSPMSKFADDIGLLGHSLSSFAANLTTEDGNQANFDNSIKALSFMGRLQERLSTTLPKIGGLHELWDGEAQTIGTLSRDLQEIGKALHDFSNEMTGISDGSTAFNYEAVQSGLETLKTLTDIVDNLTKINPETHMVYDSSYFLNNLTTITSGLNDANDILRDSNGKSIAQNLAEFCVKLGGAFKEAGGLDTEALDVFAKVANAINELMTLNPNMSFAQTGELITTGIADGIRNGESDVVQAIVDVINAAIAAGNDAAGIFSGTTTPTITPVMDLDNSELNGSAYVRNGSVVLDMSGTVQRADEASKTTGPVEVIVQNPVSLTDVTEAIAFLRQDITGLNESIQNIKIVLDTGEVAGGVTDGVDYNLGRKWIMSNRRSE